MLNHLVVLRRKKQGLVGLGSCLGERPSGRIVRASKCPLAEVRKSPGHRSDCNVTEHFPTFDSLTTHFETPCETAFEERFHLLEFLSPARTQRQESRLVNTQQKFFVHPLLLPNFP